MPSSGGTSLYYELNSAIQNATNIHANNDWISDSMSYFISIIIIQMILKMPMRLFGMTTNLLALLVYQKCGLKDGISVCFTALTISDEICLLASFMASLLGYLDLEVHVKPYLSLYYISFILPFYGFMFYNISTAITVFLAIQKCCCISLPWNFKSYFSKRRCVAAVCCIYLSGFILYIPFTATAFPFVEAFDLTTNSTRLVFSWPKAFLNDVFPILKAINYISIPFIAEILVLISTVVLAIKLGESVKFRYSASGFVTPTKAQNNTPTSKCFLGATSLSTESAKCQTISDLGKQKSSHGVHSLTAKDLRATLAVNVVAILFVTTNTPDVVVFLGSLLSPQFSSTGRYYNTYKLCIELQDLLHVVNLSMNLFIYLKFNTRFAIVFKTLFSGEKK
ncbi:adenosine receptor A1 [Biomphalaria glabrata]|nr:adenosine receptor A1-like [Biomphalaria glabrata]